MTGYEELRSSAAYLDLSARGKLKLTGADRARLLHAMSTNDIEHLEPGRGIYAFFLSAQGRIQADATIFALPDSLFIDTEPETAASLAAHLDKYIIADDVTIADLTTAWLAIGVEGPASTEAAERAGIPVPMEERSVVEFDSGFVARLAASSEDGVRIFVPSEEGIVIVDRLRSAGIGEADAEAARAVRLENKRPRYGEDMSDRYLVHESQQLHGVHFNKGCYIGQEIVERVRSQGKVHRLLTPVVISGTHAPQAGTKLFIGAKETGEVTSAAWSPALNQILGLAYLRGEGLQPGAELTIEVDSVTQQASIRL